MSILKPITEKKAKGKVKKIYDDIKSKRKITKYPIFGSHWLMILIHWSVPGIHYNKLCKKVL